MKYIGRYFVPPCQCIGPWWFNVWTFQAHWTGGHEWSPKLRIILNVRLFGWTYRWTI